MLALLITGFLLLLGSGLLMIASSEREIGLNDQSAVQALYLAEAAVERARRLLPTLPVNDVLMNNLMLGEWVNGSRMGSGAYRAAVSNNVSSIGGLPQDGGIVVCGATTCDTDWLVVITGTGSYGGASRTVQAVVEIPPILNLPAPLTILNPDVDPLFEGESFLVSGFDRGIDGSPGSSFARPAVAVLSSEGVAALRGALTPGQQSRVLGAGATPSIEVLSNALTRDALQRLNLQIARQADRAFVDPGAISEDLRGENGAGQVTVIRGSLSADSIQGLDAAGDATLEGSGHGSGVLLSTGQLTLRGSFRFDGVVILVGDGSRLVMEGDAAIIGSVLIANRTARNLGRAGLVMRDRAQVHFSEEALRGAAHLLSASLRVWRELIQD